MAHDNRNPLRSVRDACASATATAYHIQFYVVLGQSNSPGTHNREDL